MFATAGYREACLEMFFNQRYGASSNLLNATVSLEMDVVEYG